jgi:GWxTD domain-containing protein
MTTAHLVLPLRYITAKAEYEKITESVDQKEAVDQFWLNTAGTPARAKTLIQKYYNNVEEANRYFSSYHEGWKTDRGIVFIIFDRPDYVYRSDNTEEWIYGEPEHRNSLRFDFIKVKNPFTDNDYMLLRNPSMKDPWYITVQSWRR